MEFIQVNLKMVLKMDKVNLYGQINLHIKEILKKIKDMEKVNINLHKVVLKVNGEMTKSKELDIQLCMEKELVVNGEEIPFKVLIHFIDIFYTNIFS